MLSQTRRFSSYVPGVADIFTKNVCYSFANLHLPRKQLAKQPGVTLSIRKRSFATESLSTPLLDWGTYRQIQQIQRNAQSHPISLSIMGSINCKEYVTTTNPNDTPKNPQSETDGGTSGTYHTKEEANEMDVVYTEPKIICNYSDLNENEMRAYPFDEDNKVLIIKQNGEIKAVSNRCPHYGAPMNTGVLGEGRIRCPWHGACFDINSGDIEDFPGMDSLHCFRVQVCENGQVNVRAKRKEIGSNKRLKTMHKRKDDNPKTFVIVGGGPSAAVCAETLRQEGFTGRIVMISKENYLPYDRVKLSKSLSIEIETIQIRTPEFYTEHDIETLLGVEVKYVNTAAHLVECSNGYSIKYDKLYIATGSSASKPPIQGADLENVVTLREYADASHIHSLLSSSMDVVCLGASFIALETAAYFVKKVKSVTVVGRDSVPLKPVLGEEVGQRILKLFEENGVVMQMNSGITEIIGDENGKVQEVVLVDGTRLPCQLLLMGTGSRFNTDFLKGSGIKRNDNGSVDTDMHLMTNIPSVYVGGDIANAPVFAKANKRATIGHYQLAQYHGRIAALNMAEREIKELRAVPFFFTMIFGKGIRYSGYGKFKSVMIDGDLADLKFVAYYLDERDNVVAVASCGRDPIVAQYAELQNQGKRLTRSDVENQEDPTSWTKMLVSGWDPCKRECN